MLRRPRIRKFKRKLQLKPPGSMPETLVADPASPKPVISVLAYGPTGHVEKSPATIEEVGALKGQHAVVWVNIDGLGDASVVQAIGDMFALHRLALEDVLTVVQRAKVDDFGEHLFIVLREPQGAVRLDTDQVSIFLGRGFVVTFQEKRGDCLGPLRDRIRHAKGRICASGPDYLAYSIIDSVIDAYFPVVERFGEHLETIEEQIVGRPRRRLVHDIHEVKRELLTIRRAMWPAREAVSTLLREESELISADTKVYLRDAYDHLVQLIDMVETMRELGADMMDIYLSSVSHRLNEVMRTLTVVATIFMPLSFIASLYGMNFDLSHPANMPELRWKYGYLWALGLMLATTIAMMYWFRRRGLIGNDDQDPPQKPDQPPERAA